MLLTHSASSPSRDAQLCHPACLGFLVSKTGVGGERAPCPESRGPECDTSWEGALGLPQDCSLPLSRLAPQCVPVTSQSQKGEPWGPGPPTSRASSKSEALD